MPTSTRGTRKREGQPHLDRRRVIGGLGAAAGGLLLAGPATVLRGRQREIVVGGRPVEVVITPVGPRTVRLSAVPIDDSAVAADVPLDGALMQAFSGEPLVRRRVAGSESVIAGELRVRFTPDPATLRVDTADGRTLQELALDPDTGATSFLLGDAPLLGMGEGGPQFDRRGHAHTMRSGQGGYRLRTHGGVVPIQWFIGTEGWALYIHQPLGTFDLTGGVGEGGEQAPERSLRAGSFDTPAAPLPERGRFDPPEDAPLPLDAFVVGSDDPAEIMAEWARLTGHPEMPPLWSFGYLQSHRTLSGPEEVRWVARTFREKRLPCDALIYLGTGFTPSGWNTNNGEFTWNRDVFPDPEAMIDELHAMNFRVVVHVVLEGRRLTGTVDDPCPDPPAPGETGSGRDWPREQRVSCYWPIHRGVIEQGVDGWWPDQGDGLDAESRLARNRMYWEGTQLFRPGERVFALHRNGYAGMQRYAAFLWSGDVYTTWETLATHVPVAINTALSGIPYWGTDIGGFVPTAEYTGELHVRWFQFGAFCPLFRAHGRNWHLRLPWGWGEGELGPSEITNYRGGAADPDPDELDNLLVEPICKKYLELRYRLMPYLYTAVRECHETGMPIVRAMWLHHADEPEAVARGDQYLWGRDILVAPVVEQAATSRRLYLPRGTWHDFWTEERLEGGREIERPVDLATTPLYVRAGAVVPMGPIKQYTGETADEPLRLTVYPGADATSFLYEDDGHSFAHREGDLMKLEMGWSDAARRLSLRLVDGSRMRPPSPRSLELRVAGERAVRSVAFDGRPLDLSL